MSFVMPSVIVVAVTPGPGMGVGPLGVGDGVWLARATVDVGSASPAEPTQAATISAMGSGTSNEKSCANLTTYESYAASGCWFNRAALHYSCVLPFVRESA